jgi:hypothetical protein
MTELAKKCPTCRGVFEPELQVCCNCGLCFPCARKREEKHPPDIVQGRPLPPSCTCGHNVVPYASKEYRRRFRFSNPDATIVGRDERGVLIADLKTVGRVRLVGGTPESPTCIR